MRQQHLQGFDRHPATRRATVATNSMLASLLLPMLQSLQTKAVADTMSSLHPPATLCWTKDVLQIALQQTTALAQAQLLADE